MESECQIRSTSVLPNELTQRSRIAEWNRSRHCEEPTGPARSGRPDDRLRDEAIQELRSTRERTGLLRFARNDGSAPLQEIKLRSAAHKATASSTMLQGFLEPAGGIKPPSHPYEGRVLSLNYAGILQSASHFSRNGTRSSFLRWRMSFSENRCPLFRDMR